MNKPASLKAALDEHGLWARKRLGQHFLLDPSINARIAAAAGPLAGRAVIEIGPGPGGLTRALLDAGAAPLIAVEKDRRFLPLLEPLAAAAGGRLRIVEGDALEIDETRLLKDAGVEGPALIVGNLPYNVATPLLVKWLKAGAWRGAMTLMFQKEVAQRIVAAPGDSAYGRLAVLAQAVCTASIVFTLPPGAFTPPPKVDSAVVRLDPLPASLAPLGALERVTAAAFGQRRKMLRSSLKPVFSDPEAVLAEIGAPATARAEELSVAQFASLARRLASGPPAASGRTA